MTKPESETDPWAKVRTFDVSTYGPGVLGGGAWSAKAAVYLAKEVDAARAAEAAQHRQFKAAIATALCVENEHGPVSEESIVEAAEVTLGQLFDLSARLAAVEAERDNLKGAMAADDARLRAAGERVDIQFGSDTADWMAEAILSLRAERDRLKAALSKITALDFEKFNGRHNFYSGAVMFVKAWLLAYAALTPHQGQSTDGETR